MTAVQTAVFLRKKKAQPQRLCHLEVLFFPEDKIDIPVIHNTDFSVTLVA